MRIAAELWVYEIRIVHNDSNDVNKRMEALRCWQKISTIYVSFNDFVCCCCFEVGQTYELRALIILLVLFQWASYYFVAIHSSTFFSYRNARWKTQSKRTKLVNEFYRMFQSTAKMNARNWYCRLHLLFCIKAVMLNNYSYMAHGSSLCCFNCNIRHSPHSMVPGVIASNRLNWN